MKLFKALAVMILISAMTVGTAAAYGNNPQGRARHHVVHHRVHHAPVHHGYHRMPVGYVGSVPVVARPIGHNAYNNILGVAVAQDVLRQTYSIFADQQNRADQRNDVMYQRSVLEQQAQRIAELEAQLECANQK